jgi:multisubunit Na+/H+ antiporter MnhG subunit
VLLALASLLGAAVCALGVYLWRFWPEQWQAGLVFVLFGFLVLAPVTIWGIQARRNIFRQFPASK